MIFGCFLYILVRYTSGVMVIEESRSESFDESVGAIAEKVRAEQELKNAAEKGMGSAQQRALELEKIRNELRESYGGSDDDGDDDGDDDDDSGGGGDTEQLQPASLDGSDQKKIDYLDGVEGEYKGQVAELVQTAVQGGISRAVTRAQKRMTRIL